MSNPSWRLKLRRAYEHLDELNDMLKIYGQSRPYLVEESVKRDRRGPEWTYRLFSLPEPDVYLPVVLGDFMFDVRSALDHIAVANVPTRRKDRASFPIFTIDPEQSHPGDEKGDAIRREGWETRTRGMSPRTLAVIRKYQPYNTQPPEIYRDLGLGPTDTSLAVLSAFQNADKHRRLVTTAAGILPDSVTIKERQTGKVLDFDVPDLGSKNLPQNGAIIFRDRFQVDVEAVGTTVIAAGIAKDERGPFRRMPELMTELLDVVNRLFDDLESIM